MTPRGEEGESRGRNLRDRGEIDGETSGYDAGTRAPRLPSRVPLLVLLLAALVLVLFVAAVLFFRSFGDELSGTSVVRDEISSGPRPSIRLTNAAGQVLLEGVEGLESVEYEATKHAAAGDPAAAKERASGVPVDVSREDGSAFVLETDGGGGTGADYDLRVPRGAGVEIESEAGDVEVSGVSGTVEIRAGAGDVTVRDAGGDVTVEAPRGDVVVRNVSTDTGEVELDVGSGDVELESLNVGTLEANVEAGDVAISGRFSGGGRLSVETGDIVARLPAEDTRELTLETVVGEVVRESPGPSGNENRPKKAGGA